VLPPEATKVAKECSYLPFGLAMSGAKIRLMPAAKAWPDELARLKRADLEKIKRNFPGYLYPDLLRAIDVSIEGLEPTDRKRYLDLRLVEAWDALPKPPDAYAWRWIAYHMVKPGREDDLRRLLLDFHYLQGVGGTTDRSIA
jgi:hypothetical protein